ncbi:hypothetical protein CDO73_02540 [Saccharibacillus sp. O23]|uniref:hypothetical protein n=1 Tax=Saccharibacillus sp. O23 TaxID=2009338 RepID=UPI000B4DEF41|nr:hypothetical protein [Saccharibacillus sp. O23]OWR32500.1 hypothetical protein CDO73_02540 [Saccharibacillus sp. O23]
MFSEEEVEEIDVLKELCENAEFEGVPIVCFEILSDIAHTKKDFSQFSSDDLLLLKKQLYGYKKFWGKADWFDNRVFLNILPKVRDSINKELLKYKDDQ